MKIFSMIAVFLAISNALLAQQKPLVIEHVQGNCYVYTTWNTWRGQAVPSNGMYVVTGDGVVLFDNPWDSTQLQPLFDSIQKRHAKKVIVAISTHFHSDRTGGIDFYKSKSIPTFANSRTIDLCIKKEGRNIPENPLNDDHMINIAGQRFEILYPGGGHAPDNIVIYAANDKVLYGGCFVKSVESTDLGNLSDADVKAWPASLKVVADRFAAAEFIIPGHGSWNNNKSIAHTLKLLEKK